MVAALWPAESAVRGSLVQVFSMTWALSAAVGAAAGVLAAPTVLVYPDMGVTFLLKGFAAAVLGGLESIPGAIVGGFLVGIIEMLAGGLISTAFQDVSAFFIRRSPRSTGSRSCGTCAVANSTRSSASIFCGKGWTCRKSRWWRSSMPTRRVSCGRAGP